MKYFKYLILLAIFFMLCGCSVDYKLVIKGKKVSETIIFDSLTNDEFNYIVGMKKYFTDKYYIDVDKKNKKIVAERRNIAFSDAFKKSFITQYFLIDYNQSNNQDLVNLNATTSKDLLLSNYQVFDVEDEPLYYADTSAFKLNISVRTQNKVLSNNADKVKGMNYYWYFDDSNLDKRINFEYDSTTKVIDWMPLLYILGGSIVVIIVVIILTRKNTKVNEI